MWNMERWRKWKRQLAFVAVDKWFAEKYIPRRVAARSHRQMLVTMRRGRGRGHDQTTVLIQSDVSSLSSHNPGASALISANSSSPNNRLVKYNPISSTGSTHESALNFPSS